MAKTKTNYVNNGRTLLSGNITNVATTIPVADVTQLVDPLPAGEHFFVTLQDSTHVEIVKVNGISGSNLINCERGYGASSAYAFSSVVTKVENRLIAENLREFARLNDRLRELTSINDLTDPAEMDGNSVIVQSPTPTGGYIIALNQDTKWTFPSHPIKQVTGTVASGITTTTMPLTGALSLLTDNPVGSYILQFMNGTGVGQCRRITSIATNSVTWAGALSPMPTIGDAFEIYRFVGKKMSDKVDRVLNLVDDFDAPSDGVTSANAAVQAALDSGKLVDGNGLTYKLTSALTTSSAAKIRNATFDISEIPASTPYSPVYAINVAGSFGTIYPLTANFSGANSIVTASGNTGFTPGGFAFVRSDKPWAATDFQVSSQGMLVNVWKTSGLNAIYLKETNQYDFLTADSAEIFPVNMVEGVLFENVYFKGAASITSAHQTTGTYVAQSGLKLLRCLNPQIKGGGTRDINGVSYSLWQCWGGKVTGVDIQRGRTRGPTTAPDEFESGSTGVLLEAGSSRCLVDGVLASDICVAVKIGGYDRICRYNTITNVIGNGIGEVGIFVGHASDYTEVSNCQIEMFAVINWDIPTTGTGIYCRGNNVNVHDNRVVSPAAYGIAYEMYMESKAALNITKNTIIANADFTSLMAGIIVTSAPRISVGTIQGFSISQNTLIGACSVGIEVTSKYGLIKDGHILDNDLSQLTCSDDALTIRCQTATSGIDTIQVDGGVYFANSVNCLRVESDGSSPTDVKNVHLRNIAIRGTQSGAAVRFAETVKCGAAGIDIQGTAGSTLQVVNSTYFLRENCYFLSTSFGDITLPDSGDWIETVTILGARPGMEVTATYEDEPAIYYPAISGRVSANDTVKIYFGGYGDAAANLFDATVNIYVHKRLV